MRLLQSKSFSLITLTSTGTLDHGMKSIFRVIRDIRNEDKKKQDAICFILGEEVELEEMEKSAH